MTANRRLCPFCSGNNDSCPFCDGGWITDGESIEVKPKPVPMIVDPADGVGDKRSAPFRPRSRKISLGPPPETKEYALQALTIAANAIASIEKVRESSNQAYFKAADSAFKTIKELISHSKNEATKPWLKKLRDTAYYHRKQAQTQERRKASRKEAAGRKEVTIVGAGGRKQQLKPMPTSVQRKGPTLMEFKLGELGMKPSKK